MKKFLITHINIFIFIFYSIINNINSTLSFVNPLSISLNNGNIFIIHKYGIDVCNQYLSLIVKTPITFSSTEQITIENISKIIITKVEDGYIICLINKKVYIFDKYGNFIFKSNEITDKNPDFYTLESLSDKNGYNYYVGFIYENKLYLYYYEYYTSSNSTKLIASKENSKCFLGMLILNKKLNVKNSGLSCHIMKHSSLKEPLTCFYILYDNNKEYFAIGFYYLADDILKIITEHTFFRPEYHECSNVIFLKSDIYTDKSIALVCLVFSTGENNCFNYNIKNSYDGGFPLDYFNCNNKLCRNKIYGLKINYFSKQEEYIFSCMGNNGNITFCIFNKSFNYE